MHKFNFDEINVINLTEYYNSMDIEEFGQYCQDLVKSGDIVEDDVLELQNRGMNLGDIAIVAGYLTTNGTMYYNEALDLARRYHMLLLTVIERNNSRHLITDSFRMYEKAVDDIYNSTFSQDLLEFIKTLASYQNFDKIDCYNKYKSSRFYGNLF